LIGQNKDDRKKKTKRQGMGKSQNRDRTGVGGDKGRGGKEGGWGKKKFLFLDVPCQRAEKWPQTKHERTGPSSGRKIEAKK